MNVYQEVKESFKRCGESEGFYDTFYDVFLGKSPEIPALFAKTDFKKQKRLLRATISIMAQQQMDDAATQRALKKIGEMHNRNALNIRPELYKLWLESLCETVKIHDPQWTKEIEFRWHQKMQEGIEFIISMY